MGESQSHRIALIAKEIRCYLRDHPYASDSVEGIADWWLGGSERYTQNDVQEALDRLVSDGVLVSTELAGRVVYSTHEPA